MKTKTIIIVFVILAIILFFFFRSRKKKNEKRLAEQNEKTSIKGVVKQEIYTKDYTVKNGETLSIIANKENVTLAEIIEVNPQIKNINLIQIGQTIKIPTK